MFVYYSLIILIIGCQDSFVLKTTRFNPQVLKTNGYFVDKNKSVYFLYNNGIILYGHSHYNETIKEMETHLVQLSNKNSSIYKNKVGWGVFRVIGENIEYDMWYPRADAPVYRRKGIILNDSTFKITSFAKPNGKEFNELDEIYHFRSFSPKPDSTNKFIK